MTYVINRMKKKWRKYTIIFVIRQMLTLTHPRIYRHSFKPILTSPFFHRLNVKVPFKYLFMQMTVLNNCNAMILKSSKTKNDTFTWAFYFSIADFFAIDSGAPYAGFTRAAAPFGQPVARKEEPKHGLRLGMLVFHAKCGEGTVLTLEGAGDDARAQINFPRHGTKWLALSVAKLTPVPWG